MVTAGKFYELAIGPPPVDVQESEPAPEPAPSRCPFASGQFTKHSQSDFVEPHSGGLIMGLGNSGMVLSVTSFITLPVGIFIALPAWVTSSKDMKKINAG